MAPKPPMPTAHGLQDAADIAQAVCDAVDFPAPGEDRTEERRRSVRALPPVVSRAHNPPTILTPTLDTTDFEAWVKERDRELVRLRARERVADQTNRTKLDIAMAAPASVETGRYRGSRFASDVIKKRHFSA